MLFYILCGDIVVSTWTCSDGVMSIAKKEWLHDTSRTRTNCYNWQGEIISGHKTGEFVEPVDKATYLPEFDMLGKGEFKFMTDGINLFKNVDVDNITLWETKGEVSFEFLDTQSGSHKPCGHLICKDIIMLKVDVMEHAVQSLAFFACDIVDNIIEHEEEYMKILKWFDYSFGVVPKRKPIAKYHFISFHGSEMPFYILCGDITYQVINDD
jgi:hypothetical protein